MTAADDRDQRRRRELSDEEHALWRGFAKSVEPLRRPVRASEKKAARVGVPPVSARAAKSAKPAKRAAPARPPMPSPAKPPVLTPLARLDRRDAIRLARGRVEVDGRLDLHGMTQGEAHVALVRFLRRAQANDARFVLVITGKGARSGDSDRGVLRRQVPLWLQLPELRDTVVGFKEAHVAHGGEGALYVRLRKTRR
jgi:DNA-nicking Smr family endonuclease